MSGPETKKIHECVREVMAQLAVLQQDIETMEQLEITKEEIDLAKTDLSAFQYYSFADEVRKQEHETQKDRSKRQRALHDVAHKLGHKKGYLGSLMGKIEKGPKEPRKRVSRLRRAFKSLCFWMKPAPKADMKATQSAFKQMKKRAKKVKPPEPSTERPKRRKPPARKTKR